MKQLSTLRLLMVGFLASICMLLPTQLSALTYHHTEHFDTRKFSIDKVLVDNQSFSQLNWEGLRTDELDDGSLVPVKFVSIALPENAVGVSIEKITPICKRWGLLASDIAKSPDFAQRAEKMSAATVTSHSLNKPLVQLVGVDYIPGLSSIATVAITPVTLDKVSKELSLISDLDFDINYQIASDIDFPFTPSDESLEIYRSLVVNPNDMNYRKAPLKISPITYPSTPTVGNGLPVYQYCIVTSRDLAPAFQKLVALKGIVGIRAGIVCIEDILADSTYVNGDKRSGIIDDAGKLRQFLLESYLKGTEYVLLGGIPPKIPIRYGRDKYFGVSTIMPDKSNLIPSDLYFGEYLNNWNVNKNEFYGECLPDTFAIAEDGTPLYRQFSYNSPVYVGRLPCTKPEEVENYLDKLEIYTMNPGFGDTGYLKNAYFAVAKPLYEITKKNTDVVTEVAEKVQCFHPDTTFFKTTTDKTSGALIMRDMNKRHYAYFDWHAHGSAEGVQFGDSHGPYYGINALDDEPCYFQAEENNALDNLDSFGYPSYSFSMSCSLMPFDCPSKTGEFALDEKRNNLTYNFGESFVLGKNYGGIAFLGNTRESLTRLGTLKQSYFFDFLSKTNGEIGKAENYSKLSQAYQWTSSKEAAHRERLMHNIYGDPSIKIYNAANIIFNHKPDFTINRVSKESGRFSPTTSSYIEIINNKHQPIFASIIAIEPSGKIRNIAVGLDTIRIDSISPNSSLSITGPNAITNALDYQAQNITFSKNTYIYANKAEIGRQIYSTESAGSVTIKSNAIVTIDALEDVHLNNGIAIESGATLRIITPKKCIVEGVSVYYGGILEIQANEVEMDEQSFFSSKLGMIKSYYYDKYKLQDKRELTPNSQKKSTRKKSSQNQWLEEGYTWTYTMRLNEEFRKMLGKEKTDDFTKKYTLESPISVDGIAYFPVRATLTFFDYDFSFPPEATDGIVALIRQDEDGNVFYRTPEDPIDMYLDCWMQTTTVHLDYSIKKAMQQGLITVPEWPIWNGPASEIVDFGEEMIEFECPTLIGSCFGRRYVQDNHYSVWPSQPAAYVAYVERLGRVGVRSDGSIAEVNSGDIFGNTGSVTPGESIWNNTDPLLYSIQRGDGTYLVLNKENAPMRASDGLQSPGADEAEVTVLAWHNMLTVTASAPTEVTIADLAGRVMDKATVAGEQQFNLSAGIYMVTINGHTGKFAVK